MIRRLTMRRALALALELLVIIVQVASVAAAGGVQTVLHMSPHSEAKTRLQLDFEILDSFGTPVPWGDLHVHHGRKMHVYVLHEELELIQHIHPDDFKNLTTVSTTFSIWLTFPVPGSWILHLNFVMRSDHEALGDAVSRVHHVSVSDSTIDLSAKSPSEASRKHRNFNQSSMMTHTKLDAMHEAAGMMNLSAVPRHPELRAVLQPPVDGLWRGQCQRLLFVFESCRREVRDVHLEPFLGAAMHAFVVQHPDNSDHAKDHVHAHGLSLTMDQSLSVQAEEIGADMCSMDMHSMDRSDSQGLLDGRVAMYIRFAETGPYAIFVQVAMSDHVHMARIDVIVQDVLVTMMPIQPPAPHKAGVRVSISVLQPNNERKMLPVDRYIRSDRDPPCLTITNIALTWFGSMCLSACDPDDSRAAMECAIPFPAGGEYRLFTVGHMLAPSSRTELVIPIYDQQQMTWNRSSMAELVQSEYVVKKVDVHPSASQSRFVGGNFSNDLNAPHEVDVQLIANGGKAVYAGACVFLELFFGQKLPSGKIVEISTLQPFMRSAARMLVVPPDHSQADLLLAHSLKESLSRPWDFRDSLTQPGRGTALWSPLDPCAAGLQRIPSPRVTGDQGGRVGQYFRFTSAGTYTILSQAHFGSSSVISRHNITVCDWKTSGFWSDRCMWSFPPKQNAHARIEEGMDVILDTEPPPLSSLTIAGNLAVSPNLTSVRLSAGTISIHRNGNLQLGTRDNPFQGTFEIHLNSSLHEFGPNAVSYLDVHGSMQLRSADADASEGIIQSWTATAIKSKSFLLEASVPQAAVQTGSQLGIVSAHGEEVAYVHSYTQGRVTLMSPLQFPHGAKALVYNLSRRIKITGSGLAALRMWNGQSDAGASVEKKEESFHHHRRLVYSRPDATSAQTGLTSNLHVTSTRLNLTRAHLLQHASRALLQRSSQGLRTVSDVGYQYTNTYRSSLKQQSLAGKVMLHGVEISNLGVSTHFMTLAAISMEDYACSVRWPEVRKYISLMNVSMHSLRAGCIEFQGCTGGLEIQTCLCFGSKGDGFTFKPQDVLQAPPWRLGVENSIVHVSIDAGPVRRSTRQKWAPAALRVGNARMPAGSLTHVLALSVSDSFFINPLGPAVIWSPAVPGRLHQCEARGNMSASIEQLAFCRHDSRGFGLASVITNRTTSDAPQPGHANLLEHIIGVPTDNSPVKVASGPRKGHAPMAHVHIHVPPEAFNIAVILKEVHSSENLWATLTWPTEATLWSGVKQQHQVFTGGIPCLPSAEGCSAVQNTSARAGRSGFYNEAVDGPLRPSNKGPVEFVLATKGEGIYGVGLTPFQSSDVSAFHDQQHFQATIAADAQRCSPGHVPVTADSDSSPDSMIWSSHKRTWFVRCVLPAQLSLNQPTRGIVLSGTAMEYFRFDLPKGKRSLFFIVKILYSDEPDVMLDFYATRNLLWTKRTPYETEEVTAHQFPAVQKDVDASTLLPFEVTNILEYPPWGTFYGVISQGVRMSESKTEVEIMVVAADNMRTQKLVKSANHDIDSLLHSAQQTVAHQVISAGSQTLQMGPADANGTAHKKLIVEVPTGVQQLHLSVTPRAGATVRASHSNWSPSSRQSHAEVESSSGLLSLSPQELYGRWGTWFVSVSFHSDSLSATGAVEMQLQLLDQACMGNPACSGRGTCEDDPHTGRWCRCEPGWYGHICEIPAASMHGGIHAHLEDQLLLVMDDLLGDHLSTDTIHVEFHSPLTAATASSEELVGIYSQMYGRDICQSIATESAYVPDKGTSAKEQSEVADSSLEAMLPLSDGGSEGQQAASEPFWAQHSPTNSTKGALSSSSRHDDHAATTHDANAHRSGTVSKVPGSHSIHMVTSADAEKVSPPHQVVLILPGGVPGVPYGSAVASSIDLRDDISIQETVVLVTAYSLFVRHASKTDSTLIISALSVALTSQVRHDAGEGPQVHVVPASSLPLTQDRSDNATGATRRLHGGSANTPQLSLMAGVVIDQLSARQRVVLEERLAGASVVSRVWRAANKRLRGSGTSISDLKPGLIVPSLLLAVNCTEPDVCDLDAAHWVDAVHTAAEAQHLQKPDDVWVFNTGAEGLIPLSENFRSVEQTQEQAFAWRAFMLWGAATLAATLVALAVYASFARTPWHQPRDKMWEGYSAVGGPAGAVGEGISTMSSPYSMSDLSPMSRSSVRISLTRNSSVVDHYRGMMGYGQLAPVEQTWSDSAGQASSLMHPLVVCRETDDDLPGTATMPSLPSGISFDSQQLRGVARTSAAGTSLARQMSTGSSHQPSTASGVDTESIVKPIRQSLFQLGGRRITQNCGAELPELHASCTPSTDHLPAYKAWMKGGLSPKHGDWLSARRWSVLMRSGEASSLTEAIDLSLSSMNPSASLAPPDSAPGGASGAMPSSKLAVIAELPHGTGTNESDELHALQCDLAEAFPRASRQASATTATVHLHDEAEAVSGGAQSGTEANSVRDVSSAHESRWDMDESTADKGSPSTVDVLSHCASQDAQLREELGICRAGNTGVSCILQARTHQWVSGMSAGDGTPELSNERSQLRLNGSSPPAAGAQEESSDNGYPQLLLRMGPTD